MMSPRRWALLAAFLAATIAAGWTAVREEEDVVAPARSAAPASAPAATDRPAKVAVPALRLEKMDRVPGAAPVRDPFDASPAPIRPANRKRAVPAQRAAAAPALPFTYAGRFESGGQARIFLTLGDRNLVAGEGDVLEQDWRVERIGANNVALTYLPLGQPLTLAIPETPQ
jgi:hypothetical protein